MTKSSNEADRNPADQPCSFSAPGTSSNNGNPVSNPRPIWVAAVAAFTLSAAAFVVNSAPSIRDVPPPLKTSSPLRPKSAPAPVTTERKKTEEPSVRVNVTPGGVDAFRLELRGRCDLISLDKKDIPVASLKPAKMTVTGTKIGLKLNSQQYSTSQLEIQPETSSTVCVDGHLYRGRMRLFLRTDGKVSAVNVVPIEEYLASVVDSEMPAKFPSAARQAQAIVARTYALYQIQHANPNSVFDLLSSQRSQKYLGVEYVDRSGRRLAGESESSRSAVQATRGVVCSYQNRLFCTYYSAVCGGQTTNGTEVFKDAADVLRTVPCEWCHDSPHYRWTTQMPRKEFQQTVIRQSSNASTKFVVQSVRQQSGPGSGQISRFEFNDGKEQLSLNGIELRERLPVGTLFSPHFQIKLENDHVVFDGRGHGHGVGFCQWGAKGQAEAGRCSLDIVRYYFPGADFTTQSY